MVGKLVPGEPASGHPAVDDGCSEEVIHGAHGRLPDYRVPLRLDPLRLCYGQIIDLALDVFAVGANDLVEHVDVHPVPSRLGAVAHADPHPLPGLREQKHMGVYLRVLVFGLKTALGLKTSDPGIVAMYPRIVMD